MSELDEREIIRRFEAMSRFSADPQTAAADLDRAKRVIVEQAASESEKGPIWRRLARNKGLRVAAAWIVGASILLGLLDGRVKLNGSRAALARVMDTLDGAPLMHKVLDICDSGSQTRRSETWYDFRSRTVLSRYAKDGRWWKISSLNYDTMKNVVYYPHEGVVTIFYRCDVARDGYPPSAASVVEEYLKRYRHDFRGAQIRRTRSTQDGVDVDIYQLGIEENEHRQKERATLVVDRRTNLPIKLDRKNWTREGRLVLDRTISFDFPAEAPSDVYDIGAPRSAKVVVDVASKERYAKKVALEQKIPEWEKQVHEALREVYRLSEEQALVRVPPSLAEPRLELERARREVRRLEHEQYVERVAKQRQAEGGAEGADPQRPSERPDSQPCFACFVWDNGIDMNRGYRVFVDGPVSLQDALRSIVGLSRFEYGISGELADVNIPGDWIVRKGSSKAQRVSALERIVQEHTQRLIQFQRRELERDVIVARGQFHFTPVPDSYNASWIHMYSDTLDPDERNGGGSGSLEKCLRYLGEVLLDQQVVDETNGSENIEVSYGWHGSGYIRRIEDETERAAKLRMLLDNISHQTGLKFHIERRTVPLWRVVERQ